MPTYEYRCAKCGEHVEVFQSFSEAPLTKHASCGGKLARVLSPAGIVLKGSGFYKTDSRRAGSKSAKKDSGGDAKSPESKSGESKSTESKSTESKSSDSSTGSSASGGSSSTSSEAKTA